MKKYFIVFVLTFVVMLFGCTNDTKNANDSKEVAKQEKTEQNEKKENENLEAMIKDEIDNVVKKAYSVHYEIRNMNIKLSTKEMNADNNDVNVDVTFEIKSKYDNFYDYPLIAGAYKRLNLDKETKKEDIKKEILNNNKNISSEKAYKLSRVLIDMIRGIENSSRNFEEVYTDFKVTVDTKNNKITKILTDRGDGEYVSYKEILPKSYDELFKEGYETILLEAD